MAWECVAVCSAITIALAHHLGLVEKVSEVVGEICMCQRCSVFWGVASILIIYEVPIGVSLASALLLSYLTDWLGLLFNDLARLYDYLWKRQRRRKKNPRS